MSFHSEDMIWLLATLVFVGAFAITAIFTPAIRHAARAWGWTDAPDGARKIHSGPVPSLGGVAVAMGILVGVVVLQAGAGLLDAGISLPGPAFWFGAAAMLMVGLYDDLRGLGFKGKFAVQLFVAYVLLHSGYRIDVSVIPFIGPDPFEQALVSIPLTLLWIVGVINAVNLLDGLDGLAAGVALICVASLAFIFGFHGQIGLVLIATLVCGALLAFLMYNFNPASIFMGDSGSLVLGYLLAVITLEGRGHVDPAMALIVPIVVLGLPLTDTGLSIIRRAASGRALFAPDRDHIHHRLMQRFSHRNAVMVLYAWAGLFGLAAALMSVLPTAQALSILVVVVVVVATVLHLLGYFSHPGMEESTDPHAGSTSAWEGNGGDGELAREAGIDVSLTVERLPTPRDGAPRRPAKRIAASGS